MSVSKPQKPVPTQEKPLFPNSVTDPTLSVPLELSKADEDRVPYTINRYLRDYQREGITFIYNNYARSRGCILGDDMGLGKTVQVIGFLAAVLHKVGTWEDIENKRPQFLYRAGDVCPPVFLIVAPLSVLYNWKDELDTWGHFHCVVVHGLKKEEELARMNKGRTEIALTTYETLRLCLDQFNKIDWDAVIVDEAHKIKNPGSQITQAMKELTCKVRIGLTGTILQNNLEELWCVMDWAVAGCLGSLGQFKTRFSDPIEQGQKHSATKRTLATGRKTVRALVRKISPWFLRRTKSIIKDQLPKKDDRVVYCSLTDFQQSVYQTVLETDDVLLLLKASEKCDCQSGRARRSCCYKMNSEGVEVKHLYFSYLAILRKVANHVALLQSTAGTSKKQEKYVRAVCEKVFEKFPAFVERCKNEAFEALSDPMYSGKMKVLQKLLKHYLKKRDKVLIFSLSTKLLDVLQSFCMAEGLDFSRLDGSTNSKQRLQIVKDFNSSAHVNLCLVSTMAGGLGLNFVGANIVVLFDPTWNPANDLQAIDRAYRIGQCRDVTVLRLISLGTVEEIIYLRQIYKQQLQSSVVGNESARRYFEAVQGVQKGELFGIKNLFRLQTQGTCLTRTILENSKVSSHCRPNKDQTSRNMDGSSSDVPGAVLDFSSGSEDEEQQMMKKKASNQHEGNTCTSPGRINLLQYGFNKVLQNVRGGTQLSSSEDEGSVCDEAADDQKMEVRESGGKACDQKHEGKESTSDGRSKHGLKRHSNEQRVDKERRGTSSPELKKARTRKDKVPNLHRFEMCSDESEDFDLEEKTSSKKEDSLQGGRGKKKQSTSKKVQTRAKYTEKIEMFTSSEDEDASAKKKRVKMHKTVSYSDLKEQTSPNLKEKNRNIDSVLGEIMNKITDMDVQEVAYTHSNQKVVGGSRAEELISRAAIRDVFERKLYSQLPANHLLDTQESLSESPPHSQPPPTASTPRKVTVDHPVTFTSKSVHHNTHTTIIIGETPRAMCRQQLGEMAHMFESSSVKDFALQIVKGTSNQRLSWLQQYYSSLKQPELASVVANSFPQPGSAQATPTLTPGESSSEPKKKDSPPKKKTVGKGKMSSRNEQRKVREPGEEEEKMQQEVLDDPPDLESEKETSCTERARVSVENYRASGGLAVMGGASSRAHTDTHSSRPLSHGGSTTGSEPTGQGLRGSPPAKSSFLTDVLGEVSVLDDLFKPKPKSTALDSTNSTSTSRIALDPNPSSSSQTAQNQQSRGRCKDFWDIVNEGNEEIINRLTDPQEVQRVFGSRRSITEESTSLWKTNDNIEKDSINTQNDFKIFVSPVTFRFNIQI
uniref:Excision repair cross-complementation group 6-like 2 n=1 Tax=Gouania willdenowi TaxID=441366 RepID=A0A8C5GEM6_GOUWI